MATHPPRTLARKIRSLEKKYENTNPLAVLTRHRIAVLAGKYQARLDRITKQ